MYAYTVQVWSFVGSDLELSGIVEIKAPAPAWAAASICSGDIVRVKDHPGEYETEFRERLRKSPDFLAREPLGIFGKVDVEFFEKEIVNA